MNGQNGENIPIKTRQTKSLKKHKTVTEQEMELRQCLSGSITPEMRVSVEIHGVSFTIPVPWRKVKELIGQAVVTNRTVVSVGNVKVGIDVEG